MSDFTLISERMSEWMLVQITLRLVGNTRLTQRTPTINIGLETLF